MVRVRAWTLRWPLAGRAGFGRAEGGVVGEDKTGLVSGALGQSAKPWTALPTPGHTE